jgi:hypothetical protein
MKRTILPLVCTLLGACAPSSGTPSGVARDSAGTRIVESARPVWRVGNGWRIEAAPERERVSADLHAVAAALLLPGGVLVVAEESGDIRAFDAAGDLAWHAGGQGEGPGEFRLLAGAGTSADTLWFYDYALRRITYLDASGRLLGVAALQTDRPNLLAVGRRRDGSFVFAASWAAGSAGPDTPLGLRRDTVDYLHFGADGTLLGRIARLPGREYVLDIEDGRLTMASPPFARAASHTIRGDDLAYGDQERWELRIIGDAPQRLRVSEAPPAVDRIRLAREIERRVELHSAGEQPGLRRFLAALPVPPSAPAYGRLLTQPDGTLWVGPAEEDGAWRVFDAGGQWLGDVVLPARFVPTQVAGDRLVGVWRDAMDVERVRVYGILR